jgi:hypothetical protein
MKFRLPAIFILCFSAGRIVAQTTPPVQIPGTKCRLAAPDGFTASASYSGFQHTRTGAFIMVNEVPAPPAAIASGFNEAAMKKGGMTLLNTEKTSVRGEAATLYTVTQLSNGTSYTKYLLLFGKDSASTLITAGFPQHAAENADALKAAILAIDCDPEPSTDPLAAAPFTLNTAGSNFKAIRFAGGNLLYSTEGKVPTNKPVLLVGSSHGKTAISSRKTFAEERLKKLPGGDKTTIRTSAEVSIDGLPGYEIIAEGGGKDGIPALIYEVVLYKEDGSYFVIVGQSNEQVAGLTETYRTLAKTFRRK